MKKLWWSNYVNNLYEDSQSGFRANNSAEKAPLQVTNDFFLASYNRFVSIHVLLDPSDEQFISQTGICH